MACILMTKKPNIKRNPKENRPCVFEFSGIQLSKEYGWQPKLEIELGSYCTICGKIHIGDFERWTVWTPVKPGSKAGRSVYTEEAMRELNEETRTLPMFHIEDRLKQKYVDLGGLNAWQNYLSF